MHELKPIYTGQVTRSIESVADNRVPVPENTENSIVIHGARDNFDNKEGTRSGIEGTHDMILMLLQNAYNSFEDHCLEINKRPSNASSNKQN